MNKKLNDSSHTKSFNNWWKILLGELETNLYNQAEQDVDNYWSIRLDEVSPIKNKKVIEDLKNFLEYINKININWIDDITFENGSKYDIKKYSITINEKSMSDAVNRIVHDIMYKVEHFNGVFLNIKWLKDPKVRDKFDKFLKGIEVEDASFVEKFFKKVAGSPKSDIVQSAPQTQITTKVSSNLSTYLNSRVEAAYECLDKFIEYATTIAKAKAKSAASNETGTRLGSKNLDWSFLVHKIEEYNKARKTLEGYLNKLKDITIGGIKRVAELCDTVCTWIGEEVKNWNGLPENEKGVTNTQFSNKMSALSTEVRKWRPFFECLKKSGNVGECKTDDTSYKFKDEDEPINDPRYFAERKFELIYDEKKRRLDFEEYYYAYINSTSQQRREILVLYNKLVSSGKVRTVSVPEKLLSKFYNTRLGETYTELYDKDKGYVIFSK